MIYSTPKRSEFLHFHQYFIDKEEKNEVLDALNSGWITTGPKTKKFEEEFAKYIGCKHAIALNSCTAGLHLSLIALDIKDGDEVLVPAITFAATANVVEHVGARPVFVDINPDTLNIDVNKIEKQITSKTKAIIPVHIGGQACEMDKINEIAKKYNLEVIEDAAHATESWYKDKKIGNLSKLTNFSFYATKNITTAEGGMITTNDDELADKIRILSLHGMSKGAWKRYSSEGYKHYDIIYPGYKYNMTDIQAALGLCQLKKIDNFQKIRIEYKAYYNELLKDVEEIEFVKEIPEIVNANHLYTIKLNLPNNVTRDQFMNMMIQENIGVSVHFLALHQFSYYKNKYNLKPEDFPEATKMSNSILSLPFYPKMSKDDIVYVTSKIKELIYKIKHF